MNTPNRLLLPETWIGAPLRCAWPYKSLDGKEILGIVARYEKADGGKVCIPFFQKDGDSWKSGNHPEPRPLFGLDSLASAKIVFVCEGEKDTSALHQISAAAVTSPGGSSAAHKADWSHLSGVTQVVLWPDADQPGEKYADEVSNCLAALPEPPRKVLRIAPAQMKLEHGAGAADWLMMRLKTWDGFGPAPLEPGYDLLDELIESLDECASSVDLMMLRAANGPHPRKNERSKPYLPPLNVKTVRLSDVAPEAVKWLWKGYLPAGMLTIIQGDPCTGKTTVALDFAARVSRGLGFPGADERCERGGVLILSAEDSLAHTLRPRLEAARADLSLVHAPQSGEFPVFPHAADWLRNFIKENDIRLVIVDPITAYLNGTLDSHKDADMRRVLGELTALAEETRATILCLRHLNKCSGNSKALYRGGGSIAFNAAARSVLLCAEAPNRLGSSGRVLAGVKCNVAKKAESLLYTLEPQPVVLSDGSVSEVCIVRWGDSLSLTADELLASEIGSKESSSARDEAATFLREELNAGPRPMKEIERLASEFGFALPTLRRAKQKMNVISCKIGVPGGQGQEWVWRLPDSETCPAMEKLARMAGVDEGDHD